jgi:hypothetical protein
VGNPNKNPGKPNKNKNNYFYEHITNPGNPNMKRAKPKH